MASGALHRLRTLLPRRPRQQVASPPATSKPQRQVPPWTGDPARVGATKSPTGSPYPGDYEVLSQGLPPTAYTPVPGSLPDPGEVVWTWVPYAEDVTQGKDPPVLLIASEPQSPLLLALPLTSKDHDRDAVQEAAAGRAWIDIGSGPWDRRQRPSEAALHRIVRVDPRTIRRAGAVLSPDVYAATIAALRAHWTRGLPKPPASASEPPAAPNRDRRGLLRR